MFSIHDISESETMNPVVTNHLSFFFNRITVPYWTWAQCDNCSRWRRLTTGMTAEYLPDKWFCRMNSDAQFKLVGFDFVYGI